MTLGYHVLLAQGIIVDRILETTAVRYDDGSPNSLYLWLRTLRSCSDRYGGDEALICTAIAFTRTAGRSKLGQRAQINGFMLFIEFLARLEVPPADAEEREKVFGAVREDSWRMLNDITGMLYSTNRRSFVADKGLMGIGPAFMKSLFS